MVLAFNAYDSLTVKAAVSKIAAKSSEVGGTVKFAVDAEFDITTDMPVIRSGYSATAEVLLERAENVLSLPEKCLIFRRDSSFVYVLDSLTHEPIQKHVVTGISDDEQVEIRNGISMNDKIITNYSNIVDD